MYMYMKNYRDLVILLYSYIRAYKSASFYYMHHI